MKNLIRGISYQPFLLVIVLIILIGKVLISLSSNQPVLDWFLLVVLVIFFAVLGVYVWEKIVSKSEMERNVSIKVGNVKNGEIIGVEGDKPVQKEKITIESEDLEGGNITGFKQK